MKREQRMQQRADTTSVTPADATPGGSPSAAIAMRGVSRRRGGVVVLRDLALTVAAGEIFGLIGPSGSGKSTTMQLLCGQLRPDTGTITVLGEAPAHFTAATRRRIGYMPQQFALYPDLTLAQNVAFAAGLYGIPPWRTRARIRAVLELVELWAARRQPARAVSGGMRRRLALAAALVHDPALLCADEPTANLDPILRARLWGHFRTRAQAGQTLLVATQYIDEAAYCDRVGLMFGGALIAAGGPEELRRRAFGGDIVELVLAQPVPVYAAMLHGVVGVRGAELPPDRPLRVVVDDAERALPRLLAALAATGATVHAARQYRPSFDEVFIRLIEQHRMHHDDVAS